MRVPTAALRLAQSGGRFVSSSPFGNYGPLLASLTAFLVILAALAVHLYGTLILADPGRGDPFLDNAALLVLGVVLGVGAVGGTAVKAEASAEAANVRLDQAGVPPVHHNGGGQPNG
jgi:hypothetical protein